MRVMTWNLWWRFGPWEERQGAIAHVLREAAPDIVCLQEVWATESDDGVVDEQVAHLAAALGGFHTTVGERRFHDGRAFSNAILSRWPMSHEATHDLPPQRNGWSHRKVVHARVDAPNGSIPVYSTHLAYRFDESAVRQEQVRSLLGFIDETRGDPATEHPPILGADLNAVPSSDEVRILTGESPGPVTNLVMTDCWPQRSRTPGHTWSSDNPNAAISAWPQRRIDYVMIGWPRPKPLGNPVACRLAGVEPVDGVQPSDHYAVVVDLDDGPAVAE